MNELWLKTRLQLELLGQKDELAAYQSSVKPCLSATIADLPIMAIDLEMTGLDPHNDQIISIGIVPIEHGAIPLSKALQVMVTIDGSVGQSAAVHGIIDNHLTEALSLTQAMAWLLAQTQGSILLAHHAPMDISFIQSHLEKVYKRSIKLPFIDTLAIEKQRLLRQHDVLQEGSLRLDACRKRYGLPTYYGHDALTDALACAELFVAQIASIGDSKTMKAAQFISI
ncbi:MULTISPECIES: exonuclease domain-containing protein [unclassified Shewanella]|uniref:exonuclease domain-containing protein n=1 Tax=unclassified Shewanella TaxID=196818 RepID=UPI000CC9D13E|nr:MULTISPECIES: exonuclease domain-containing protein [unclassified Shewanella]MDO6621065.1 exonuclease domain-containing protein [Shewanella sp. 6_MG-2023]MDO6639371.1 exonuclease domain-containing protein [Shewanella sp. 5_MG-2023]MDO6678135.1 exonuclease domain-containing protein [Shewanella sp. 4_MG-2023]PMG30337.1 DNA polymerase III subunit epsilon [Shewanella sp. 10N.286.52.C2]PMG39579.1 DNA polymerase III subunit epsilon [Shewanella sp. 10N.286.52.B9]